jgi:tetratricopeptide (TPR) repeat protein
MALNEDLLYVELAGRSEYARVSEYRPPVQHCLRSPNDRAKQEHEKALAKCRELYDRNSEWQNLDWLGEEYRLRLDYHKAADCYEKAIAICRELYDRNSEWLTLIKLGNVYKSWGQYDKAADCYEKALAICRELKNRHGECVALNYLGNVYKSWGQYDKAADYYEKALQIAEDPALDIFAGESRRRDFGQRLFNRIQREAYELICGSKAESVEKRESLLESFGIKNEMALITCFTSILVPSLGMAAPVAVVVATLLAKSLLKTTYDTLCEAWEASLP